jgi:hypothetical protein
MNITLSADEQVVVEARSWATLHGTSLNALVRDYLSSLVSEQRMESAAILFAQNAREHAGCSEPGTAYSRNATYSGKRFEGP